MSLVIPRRNDRTQLALVGRGLIAEAYPLGLVSGGGGQAVGATGVSNPLQLSLVGLRAGDVVTNLVTHIVGAGTAVTLFKLALYSKTGTFLATTADVKASLAATTFLVAPLTAAYTVPSDDAYYIGILSLATTTQVTIPRPGAFTALGTVVNSGARQCAVVNAQSDTGASVTPADSTTWFWAAAA